MRVVKRYWFPAAVTLLVGVIAFNLYTVYYRDGGTAIADRTPGSPGSRRPPAQGDPGGPGIPRTIALAVAPRAPGHALDGKAVMAALQTIGAVQEAQAEGGSPWTVRLTVVEPVKLSLLSKRLEDQGAEVVERRSPLRGDLRLHVSGMS